MVTSAVLSEPPLASRSTGVGEPGNSTIPGVVSLRCIMRPGGVEYLRPPGPEAVKFDLMSEADVGAGTGGEFEVIVGLGRSRKLRPPLPPYLAALLAPEVLVLAEDEDILEAMVSLGDEIGLNVE